MKSDENDNEPALLSLQPPKSPPTSDMLVEDRPEHIRKSMKVLRMPRLSWNDNHQMECIFIRKAPEYIDWLLDAYDTKVELLVESEKALNASVIDLARAREEIASLKAVASRTQYSQMGALGEQVGLAAKPALYSVTPALQGNEDNTQCVQDLETLSNTPRPKVILTASQNPSNTHFWPEEMLLRGKDDAVKEVVTNIQSILDDFLQKMGKPQQPPARLPPPMPPRDA